ncbi:MAG: YlmH/Sll1252 family protein, partial [Oscillospiraceae bacterium]|nr:YlmH/Sll1252 family protein [Oscillospiraceae bacterium]
MGYTSDEELTARAADAVRLFARRDAPVFLGFLDPHAAALVAHVSPAFRFDGGHPDAERTMAGIFPDGAAPVYPFSPLGFTHRRDIRLSHRDVLGTLLSRGIERDTVGDILCTEGLTVAFVADAIAGALIDIDKIGGEGV